MSHRALSPEQFQDHLEVHSGPGQNPTLRALAMTHQGKLVGGITWHPPGYGDPRRIDAIWVHPDMRRRGIGTRLKSEVESREGYRLRHSIIRSPEGDAWARATGGAGAKDPKTVVTKGSVTDEEYHYFLHHLRKNVIPGEEKE